MQQHSSNANAPPQSAGFCRLVLVWHEAIAQHTRDLCSAMGMHSADKGISATDWTDWTVNQPLLADLRVYGRPIHNVPPDKPL